MTSAREDCFAAFWSARVPPLEGTEDRLHIVHYIKCLWLNFLFSFFLGHVKSSVTGYLGKAKVDLKEASKFVSG